MSSEELTLHELLFDLNQISDKFKMVLEKLEKEYANQSVFNPDVARMSYLLGQKEFIEGLIYMANNLPIKQDEVSDDDEWN